MSASASGYQPATPASAVRICAVEDFPECTARVVRASGRDIAVWRQRGDNFFALDNACYHHGSPLLPKGSVRKFGGKLCISCPWHSYKITLAEGEGLYYGLAADMKTELLKSKGRKQRPHRVILSGESVYVDPSVEGAYESDQYYRRQSAEAPDPEPISAELVSRDPCCPSGGTQLLTFRLSSPLAVLPRPAQFADFTVARPGAEPVQRSWTMVAAGSSSVSIAVRRKEGGAVSGHVTHGMKVGEAVTVWSVPRGAFLLPETPSVAAPPPLMLVAGGVGITPHIALLRSCYGSYSAAPRTGAEMLAPKRTVVGAKRWRAVLLYSERSAEDFCFAEELAAIEESAARAGGSLRVIRRVTGTPPDGWDGPTGRITASAVEEACEGRLREQNVYLCGPGGFVAELSAALLRKGVPADSIVAEDFS
eukprot:TRINITY_DN941_c0_g1_i1.p1 TRINITY_DN941_c0_g1~~TRINITY_DN941_c0_g1_i1.p1  ORF type:complete len:460 (+),score=149.86 TRINITY_DN941_c0_g1_i1:116-1381(+)